MCVCVCVCLREEDEFSELRSDLSHSQQEVNEDDRSVDQDPDQASVSLPENQSTLVTADMGKSSCTKPEGLLSVQIQSQKCRQTDTKPAGNMKNMINEELNLTAEV